jgi:hypothetical protein
MSFSISKKAGSIHLHFPKNLALSHACLKVDTVDMLLHLLRGAPGQT